jgi:hypothetical protein
MAEIKLEIPSDNESIQHQSNDQQESYDISEFELDIPSENKI